MKLKDVLPIIKDLVDSGYGEKHLVIVISTPEFDSVEYRTGYELTEEGYIYLKLNPNEDK